ncbi:adenylate cyclase [Schizosaccharomyces cryophilus OY26]|uniref:Adenylate cyclase n=1 Tax=Schizosaccharomyces cryophilus (strain OY26 / ATCC MYA-4695 / CBS 11777 / NBRC 106824 / NRRL Y48691) TaxID=653667 RepID=S9X9M3_SCHCR|nr:adenylate cyclase [Schizosaccharomyces cryophilus OY26]EPY53837.1 adenylate cyclase [Schizosaccharomyces cryophilus OY26]
MIDKKRLFRSPISAPPENFKSGIPWLDSLDEEGSDTDNSVYEIPESIEESLSNVCGEALSPCTRPVNSASHLSDTLHYVPSDPSFIDKRMIDLPEPDAFSLSSINRSKSDSVLLNKRKSEDYRGKAITEFRQNYQNKIRRPQKNAPFQETKLRHQVSQNDSNQNDDTEDDEIDAPFLSLKSLRFPESVSDDDESSSLGNFEALDPNDWWSMLDKSGEEKARSHTLSTLFGLDYHRESYDSSHPKSGSHPSVLSDDSWKAPESWAINLPSEVTKKRESFSARVFAHPSHEENSKPFFLRVYRDDRTSVSFSCPMNIKTSDIIQRLARLFFLPFSANFYLLLVQFKTERVLLPHEQPCIIFQKLLTYFGCDQNSEDEMTEEDNYSVARLVFTTMDIGADVLRKMSEKKFSQHLDIRRSNLEVIPIKFYPHAHELLSLNISSNLSLGLPIDFMERCVNLKNLDMSHNLRPPRGKSLSTLRQLEVLNVSRNDIYELDPVIFSGRSRSTLKEFYCSLNKLLFLPYSIRYLTHLTVLDLSYNNFVTFPLIVTELTSLEVLNFSHNNLYRICSEVNRLGNLKELYLQSNDLSGQLTQQMGSLRKLEIIDLRFNSLSNIGALSECPNLKEIRASYNIISHHEFPCSSATYIDFSHCPLTILELPNKGFSSLVYLDASHAKLVTIKESMMQSLVNLETLNMSYNHFVQIPDTISNLKNLKFLYCTNCEISYVSPELGKLSKLTLLDLHANNIKVFPEEVWQISALKMVNLSSNILEKIKLPMAGTKQSTRSVSQLKIMRTLSGSPISNTSSSEYIYPSVEELILVDNRLGDDCFKPISFFKEIRILNLSYNYLTEIPNTFFENFSHLNHVFLSGNKLSNISITRDSRVSLESLYVNGNRISSFPKNETLSQSLRFLDLGNNNLQSLAVSRSNENTQNISPKLESLDLSGNSWFQFPKHDDSKVTRSNFNRLKVLSVFDVNAEIPVDNTDILNRVVHRSSPIDDGLKCGISGYLSRINPVISTVELILKNFIYPHWSLYCIFDSDIGAGHYNRVLKFAYENIASCLAEELSTCGSSSEQVRNALRKGFLKLNKKLGNTIYHDLETVAEYKEKNESLPKSDKGYYMDETCMDIGVSIALIYIRDTRAFVANVGTSMSLMSTRNDSEPTLLSNVHDTLNKREIRRVIDSAGLISGRIKSTTTRAIGRLSQFPGVQAVPHVNVQPLSELNEFIVLANKEFWNVMSKRIVIDIVRTNRHSMLLASTKLRDYAIAYGAKNNTIVMVLDLSVLFETNSAYAMKVHKDEEDSTQAEGNEGVPFSSQNLPDDSSLARMNREVSPPHGSIAMVFTDIKNSTLLWERHPVAMRSAIKTHNTIMRRQLRATGGYEVKTEGDAFMVCFQTVPAALLWSFSVQLQMLSADWPNEIVESVQGRTVLGPKNEVLYRGLSVRIGVNYGVTVSELDPITRRMDYYGPMVNRTSRVASVADGGQIAVSADVVTVLNRLESDAMSSERSARYSMEIRALKQVGYIIHSIGEFKLKGLETPENISLVFPLQLEGRLERLIKNRNAEGANEKRKSQEESSTRSRSNSLRPILARIGESKFNDENQYARSSLSSVRSRSPTGSSSGYEGNIFEEYQYQRLFEICERLEDRVATLHGYPEPPESDPGLAAPVNIAEEYALFYRLTLRIENTIYCVGQMLGHT